jgi:hypothetical protein
MGEYLEALRNSYASAEIIYRAENRVVIRWHRPDERDSIIIKMWSRPDVMGKVRRMLRLASSDIECRSLLRAGGLGVPVPHTFGSCPVLPTIAGYTDALFLEDLGECELSTDHLKNLIHSGREQEALHLEDAMIDMAEIFLRAGMLDVDHGFANTLLRPSGQPVRLDLELARRVFWPRLFPGMFGQMLGRMIGMHAFAVQPDTHRTERFAQRLLARIQPPRRALTKASTYARAMLQKQRAETGIDTSLTLPWD